MEFTMMNLINVITYFIKDILMCFTYVIFAVHIFGGKYKKKPFIVAGVITALLAASVFNEFYLRTLGEDGIMYMEYNLILSLKSAGGVKLENTARFTPCQIMLFKKIT